MTDPVEPELSLALRDLVADTAPPLDLAARARRTATVMRRRRRYAVGTLAVLVAGCTAGAVLTVPGRTPAVQVVAEGGLSWAARGDRAADQALIADATAAWNLRLPGPVRELSVLYAGSGGAEQDAALPDTVVVLQGRAPDGTVRIGWVTSADSGTGLVLRTQTPAPEDPGALQIGSVVPTAVHGRVQWTALDLPAPGGYRVVVWSLTGQDLRPGEGAPPARDFGERMVTAPGTSVTVVRDGHGVSTATIGTVTATDEPSPSSSR